MNKLPEHLAKAVEAHVRAMEQVNGSLHAALQQDITASHVDEANAGTALVHASVQIGCTLMAIVAGHILHAWRQSGMDVSQAENALMQAFNGLPRQVMVAAARIADDLDRQHAEGACESTG